MVMAMSEIVHEKKSVREALAILEGNG
jgi:hypothetical protein